MFTAYKMPEQARDTYRRVLEKVVSIQYHQLNSTDSVNWPQGRGRMPFVCRETEPQQGRLHSDRLPSYSEKYVRTRQEKGTGGSGRSWSGAHRESGDGWAGRRVGDAPIFFSSIVVVCNPPKTNTAFGQHCLLLFSPSAVRLLAHP